MSSFNSSVALLIDSGCCSIDKCLKTLNHIVQRHWIFRTRLIFDAGRGYLFQFIDGQRYSFPVRVSTYSDDNEKVKIVRNEMSRRLDTEHEGVFRCHFIQQHCHYNEDILSIGDVIIFTFHHSSFDGYAVNIVLEEFKLAYANSKLQPVHLQYLDYSIYERTLPMVEAKNYWREALRDYAWDRQLNLGTSRTKLSACRTGRGSTLNVTIPAEITRSMIAFVKQYDVTLFQLGLSCFYLFLLQISSENQDACVGIIHLNRYRPELASVIGMFVNVLPCRIFIESIHTLSFIQLVYKVQHLFLASVPHAHFPYEELLKLHRTPTSNLQLPFLQTCFRIDALTDFKNLNGITLDDSCRLSRFFPPDRNDGYKFDLIVALGYNETAEKMWCKWYYMFDIFEPHIIDMHANRFSHLLTQLFGPRSAEQIQLPLGKTVLICQHDRNNKEKENVDRIQAVFAEVLGCTISDVDVNKSFFEQNGTSLKALQAVTLMQQNISIQINIQLFLDHPTVNQLARIISSD